jgi:hypothetical protein
MAAMRLCGFAAVARAHVVNPRPGTVAVYVHFVEGVTIRNLKPEPGQVDAHLFALAPQALIGLGRDLDDSLADKPGELVEFLVQRILAEQVVAAGIGLLRTALLAVAMFVKQFQQGGIYLLIGRIALGQNNRWP